MKRRFLENMGLSKEQVDSILDENSHNIGKTKAKLEAVKSELDEARKQNEGLITQLEEANKQLSKLQKLTDDADSLKKRIENLQKQSKADSEKHSAELKQLKIDQAVELALIGAKAKNTKAVKALLDLENAELTENGTIKGLSKQLEKLSRADDSRFLFASARPDISTGRKGGTLRGSWAIGDIEKKTGTY
ncbi:MAG: phage scaffolding protein, partial [Eubacterium sp.]|nr:phage scaffolding protein [Eubacterium sp.]